jgi:hypothetical protein
MRYSDPGFGIKHPGSATLDLSGIRFHEMIPSFSADLLASLLFLYDPSWQLARAQLLMGQKTLAGNSRAHRYKSADIKAIKKYVLRTGTGTLFSIGIPVHLAHSGGHYYFMKYSASYKEISSKK